MSKYKYHYFVLFFVKIIQFSPDQSAFALEDIQLLPSTSIPQMTVDHDSAKLKAEIEKLKKKLEENEQHFV